MDFFNMSDNKTKNSLSARTIVDIFLSSSLPEEYGLTTPDRFVLTCLGSRIGNHSKQICWVSHKNISDYTGLSRSSVIRSTKSLVEKQLIIVSKKPSKDTRSNYLKNNTYKLTPHLESIANNFSSSTSGNHPDMQHTSHRRILREENNIINNHSIDSTEASHAGVAIKDRHHMPMLHDNEYDICKINDHKLDATYAPDAYIAEQHTSDRRILQDINYNLRSNYNQNNHSYNVIGITMTPITSHSSYDKCHHDTYHQQQVSHRHLLQTKNQPNCAYKVQESHTTCDIVSPIDVQQVTQCQLSTCNVCHPDTHCRLPVTQCVSHRHTLHSENEDNCMINSQNPNAMCVTQTHIADLPSRNVCHPDTQCVSHRHMTYSYNYSIGGGREVSSTSGAPATPPEFTNVQTVEEKTYQNRQIKKCSLPNDFYPDEEGIRIVQEKGIPLNLLISNFIDKQKARAKTSLDWQAEFRVWARTENPEKYKSHSSKKNNEQKSTANFFQHQPFEQRASAEAVEKAFAALPKETRDYLAQARKKSRKQETVTDKESHSDGTDGAEKSRRTRKTKAREEKAVNDV